MQIDFDFCAPHFYACPMECENKAIVHKTNATVQIANFSIVFHGLCNQF